jgi:hypothetical protein
LQDTPWPPSYKPP